MEQYSPGRNKWSMACAMPEEISGLRAVAWRDRIVITGGWNGIRFLKTCYSYDPKSKGWRRLADMNTARCNHSLTMVGNRLVVAGGCDGTRAINVVEMYDLESNSWRVVSPLAARRAGLGSCAVPLSALDPQLRDQLVSPDNWLARQHCQLATAQDQLQDNSSQEEMEGLEPDAEFEIFDGTDMEDNEGHNLSDEDSEKISQKIKI
jgi:hypothetical protein